MTDTAQHTQSDPAQQPQLESFSPIDGSVVGRYPVADRAAVEAAVAKAREAAGWWADLGFDGRKQVLDQWRSVMARRMSELAAVVHEETGKPRADAALEIGLAVDHLAWAAGHAQKVLGPRKVSSGLLMANQVATLEYLPRGVIGVIGPWNYPVFTPMGSIAYALAAGNTVVFKPSELTPGTGQWLADTLAEVVPGHALLQCIHGRGEVGDALCRSGVDKLAFTGSTATGKKVMAACADTLTPVLIEAGGKDALLVADDADVKAAADAAAWGAFSNAGQTCIGTERVYVHERVADEFLRELTDRARKIHVGPAADSKYGPMTLPTQTDVVRRHVDDAIARGGHAVVGGSDAIKDGYVQPTVLVDVPEDSDAVTQETFGPTVVVNRVASMDEAVERANATSYGLGGAVFSKSSGPELARAMRSGMVSVNGIISFAAIPALPFGGVGDSGFGRIHGADGLREFASPKAVARMRVKPPMNLTSFGRTAAMDKGFATLIATLYGRATHLPKLPKLSRK